MEDLRVLEQQQRESQRKLAATKLSKQHKLEQQASLESKLSSLKYANGEQRAQLVRARDVLSRSTREVGASKLMSSKSGDALKAFDSRLKRALEVHRKLKAACRKIDAQTITLLAKDAARLRLRAKVEAKMELVRQETARVRHKEESLLEATQEERNKAKTLIEKTAALRADINGLEEDLSGAQTMAASTKSRAESIAAEVVEEDKRHEKVMQEMRLKMEALEKKKAEKNARKEAMLKEMKVKKAELHGLWERCVEIQKEEGHELSPEPTDDGPAPSLDLDKCKAKLKESRAALLAEQAERDRLKESLVADKQLLADLVAKAAAANQEAESIRKEAEAAQKVERERREAHDKFLEDLEKDRASVTELRRAKAELEESIGSDRKRRADQYSEQEATIQKRQAELEESRAELAAAVETIEILESALEESGARNTRLLQEAKQSADTARTEFEEVREEVEALEAAPDPEIQKEVEDILQAQSILAEDAKDEIAQLCEGKYNIVAPCSVLCRLSIALHWHCADMRLFLLQNILILLKTLSSCTILKRQRTRWLSLL